MIDHEAHPSPDVLSAFSLGQLPREKADEVEGHVGDCETCCETLLGLADDDTFVGLLKDADHTAVESGDDVPGALVDHPRYDVVGLIGRGGMGDVYEARHRLMNRTVALKVINREFIARPEVVERFRREVETAAQLSHANVVAAYDAEQAGDLHFLVMEHVDGTDLSRVVKDRGPLPVEEACDYVRQAALGLDEAHRLGLTHRDIKPHNLMVTADGTVKVLDFGLASLVAGPDAAESGTVRSDLTSAGTVMGTPDFISPEQAADARNADARSDVYSLGATLYFLLTGRPLFTEGDVVQKLRSHAEEEPEPLDSVRDGLPEGLATVVSRMLAKDPDERFQTAAEVAVALEPFGHELRKANVPEISAQPPRRGGPFSRMTALAAGFFGLVLAAAVYFVVTDKGVVRVEVFDDTLEVAIDGDEITLDDNGKRRLVVRRGEHKLVVRVGETELITEEFELSRDGEVTFRVNVEKGKVLLARVGGREKTAELPGARKGDAVAEEWSRLDGRWQGVVAAENGQRIEMPFELVVDGRRRTMTIGSIVPAQVGRPSRSVGKPATAAVELDPTTALKRMTAEFPEDGRGKMFGIYELDGVELTLCLSADGFPHASTIEEGFGQGNGSRYELVRVTSRDNIPLVFDVRDGEPVVEIDGRPVGDYRTYLNMMAAANPGIVIRMDIGPAFDPQLGSHLLDFASVVEAATFPPREAKTELSPAASAVAEEHHDRVNILNRRVFALKRIGMAFQVLHESEDRFPFGRPEDHPEWFDKDGRPHLSWRVHVLPALGLDELHEKFRLDEPWDSPHNKPLLAEMPDLYKTTGGATKTSVQMVVGPGTLYDGKSGLRLDAVDIADGSSQTALLVDAGTERAVLWTKPQDLPFDAKDPIRAFGTSAFGDEQHVLTVDGATKFVRRDTDPEQLRRLFLRGDGKPLDLTKKRTTPLPTAVDDREAIQGVWKIVSSNGRAQPANVGDAYLVFTADTSTRIVGDDRSTRPYRIDPTTSPKRIDLLHEEGGPDEEEGIYELDGDTLRLAFTRGRPKSFEVEAGPKAVLVLERVEAEPSPMRGDVGDREAIRGTWRLESTNGKPPQREDPGFEVGIVFGAKTLKGIEGADAPAAPYTIDPTKTPKQIDIRPADEPAMLGIYELEADTLRIGFSFEEGRRPTSLERSAIVLRLKWQPTAPVVELRWAATEHIPGFTQHENRGDYTGDTYYSLKPVLTLTPEFVESAKHLSGTFPPSGGRIFHWVTIRLNEKALALLEKEIEKVKADPAKAKTVEHVTLLVDGEEGFAATLLLGWKDGVFTGPNWTTGEKAERIVKSLKEPTRAARFGFGDQIESLEYSRDGKRLISSGSGWGTAVWDAQTGDLIRHVPEEGTYLVASLSPDGTLMSSARNARTVTVRSVETGEVVCSIDGGFRSVRFAPDGKSVFTVVGNRVTRVDVATGEQLPAFAGVGGGSSTFAVAPTGTLVAGIASPRSMAVWDWKELKEVARARSLRMGHGSAKDIVFTPDGKSLVLLGEKNTGADLRDARTLEVTKEFPGDDERESTCVDVSADGSRMAFGSEGGLVFVYDLTTGKLVGSWRAHSGHIAAVALSPDGTRLACGTRRSGSVRIWNVETQKPVFSTDTNQQQTQPGEGNAALVYWQAFALLPELSGEDAKLLTDLEKSSELGVDAKSLLTRSETALNLVSHLQPETPCRWAVVENGPSTLLPHLSEARMLARLLVLQARVDAESGKPEAAVDHLTQAFLVARNIDEGALVQMLVGDAIESLAADATLSLLPEFDASARGRFAEALSKLPTRTTFAHAVRYERDVFGRGAGRMIGEALDQLGKDADSPAVRAILAESKKQQETWLEELLAEYDKAIEASQLPLSEANKELERLEAGVQESPNPLIRLLMPSLVGTNQRHARVDARIAELESRLRDVETGKADPIDTARRHLRAVFERDAKSLKQTYADEVHLLSGHEFLKEQYGLGVAGGRAKGGPVERVKLVEVMRKQDDPVRKESVDEVFAALKFEKLDAAKGEFTYRRLQFAVAEGDELVKISQTRSDDFILLQLRQEKGTWQIVAEYLD